VPYWATLPNWNLSPRGQITGAAGRNSLEGRENMEINRTANFIDEAFRFAGLS
jgi:hypothetical protein